MPKYKIRKDPIFISGCDQASFVVLDLNSVTQGIIYALVSSQRSESHSEVYEEAIENGIIRSSTIPIGGGIINLETLEFTRGSIYYGQPDSEAVERITAHLERMSFNNRSECY